MWRTKPSLAQHLLTTLTKQVLQETSSCVWSCSLCTDGTSHMCGIELVLVLCQALQQFVLDVVCVCGHWRSSRLAA